MGYHDRHLIFRNDRHVLLLSIPPVSVDAVQGLPQAVFFFVNGLNLDIILDPREQSLLLLEFLQFLLDGFDLGRVRVPVQFCPRSRLVDDVDGLVRQEPVGDVAVGEPRCGHDGFIGDLDLVVRLIFRTETLDDVDRFVNGRGLYVDGLEAPLQRAVLSMCFLNSSRVVAPMHWISPRASAGLSMLDASDGAFGSSGADQRVEFINEEDNVVRLDDLLHDDLETFFELAAVFGPRNERPQVEGHHAAVQDVFRHIGGHDPPCKAFHDGCFADPGLADDHGVVLGPAGKYLKEPVYLGLASDNGIELAALGQLGEVPAEFIEGGGRALLGAHLGGGPAQIIDDDLAGAEQVRPEAPEDLSSDAFFLTDEPEEQVFASYVAVSEEPRFLYGVFKDFFGAGVKGISPKVRVLPPAGRLRSTSMRICSISTPIFLRAATGIPSSSLSVPSRRCSVPR